MKLYDIIVFNDLFNNEIYVPLINSLLIYELIVDGQLVTRKKDTQNLIEYFTAFYCIKFLKASTGLPLIFIQKDLFKNIEFESFGDLSKVKRIVLKNLKTLYKKYPANFFFSKNDLSPDHPDNAQVVQAYIFKYVQPNTKGFNQFVEICQDPAPFR